MTYSGRFNRDPGEIRANEEMLERQRQEKIEQDRIEEERRILEEEVPYWQRQIDLEKNPPLENFEYNLGVESKRLENQRLIGSRFFDTIEGTVGSSLDWLKQQAKDDPDRYTDDMLRLLGGGLQNTAWAISKLPFINEIAKGEDWLAEQARGMSEYLTPFLDPRFAGWGTRIATGLLADKGISKAIKGSKVLTSLDDLKDAAKGYGHAFGFGLGGTGGSWSTSGRVGSGQLSSFFGHEEFITKPRRGPAKLGHSYQLIPDKSRKVKARSFIKKDIDYNKYRLSDGSYDLARFERNIRDLLEVDQIRASDVPVGQLHKVKGTTRTLRKTVGVDAKYVESLYGDYLAGYFNTYGNLDDVARLRTPSGKIIPAKNRDLVRNMRLFRMNPDLFYSGGRSAFKPKIRTAEYNKKLKKIITENKTTQEFIEGTNLQRHHLAVINEIWPLFDGLIGNDVDRMRQYLKDLGVFVGNDPKNMALLPKKFHNPIVHDVLWKAFRPNWAGNSKRAKELQDEIKRLFPRAVDREQMAKEFKEQMDIINRQLDLGLKEFIKRNGNINSKNINELKEFLQTIVERDMNT